MEQGVPVQQQQVRSTNRHSDQTLLFHFSISIFFSLSVYSFNYLCSFLNYAVCGSCWCGYTANGYQGALQHSQALSAREEDRPGTIQCGVQGALFGGRRVCSIEENTG